MSFESVRSSYGVRAGEYVATLGSIGHAAKPDLYFVARWASDIEGPVLDVGCGPGQWTHYLDAEGLDPVPEFVEFARCIRPGGGLALGFFTGPKLESFDHAIATAYYWPVELFTSKVEAAGFSVTYAESRPDRPSRMHAAIRANRT